MTDQTLDLFDRASAMCDDPFFREVVWRHCPFLGPDVTPAHMRLAIHSGDQMLWHSVKHLQDPNAAFSQYYNVALQQYSAAQQVVRSLLPGLSDRAKILDFACGYGRLLRFLTLSLPTSQIWASDIQPDALAFVRENFGVTGLPSYQDPEAFQPNERFELIWVASLFSHLPSHLFEAWMKRLMACLEPDGALCFSAHDACLLPDGTHFPNEGILFRPFSENADLDSRAYGTTHVSEGYVRGVVEHVCGAGHGYFRIPRGLAHEQDLYIVPAMRGRDLSRLHSFRYGPWGWVDQRELRPAGELYLRGWAASLDDGPLDAVEIRINGEEFRCPTGRPRADVARVLSDKRLSTSGWEFCDTPSEGSYPLRVSVTARTESDEKALLYAGILPSPEALVR